MTAKPRLLSLLGCYWPGNEATGPNQSFRAFATALRTEFDIRIVARDGTGTAPLGWQSNDPVPRLQLPIGRAGARGLLKVLRETPHDILLLNGFHDREFTIPALIYRKLGLIPRKPVILSPRGEFAQGALSLKSNKKQVYQKLVRSAGLTRDIWFHATADHEHADILKTGLTCRGVLEAPNARSLPDLPPLQPEHDGPLRLAFLGRVAPVKNLHFALDVLSRVSSPVEFNIFGPFVDAPYWRDCLTRIAQLPDHVSVTGHGPLPHDAVPNTLAGHDLFFLPTMGENFGHAINEALSAGLPALIADTTPWRGLEPAGAGWDLALECPDLFAEAIDEMAKTDPDSRRQMRTQARRFAEENFTKSNAISANRTMLLKALDEFEKAT